MVERMWLTPDVVDALPLPGQGERWIADTQVRGFGLRLWPTGRAYAIRVSDQAGRAIRRSFAPDWGADWRDWDMDRAFSRSPDDEYAPRLGRFLDAARDWARVEIARAKGRSESAETEATRLAKLEVTRAAERARHPQKTAGESVTR